MTVTRELVEILTTVVRPGDFFFSARTDFPMPRIEVDGVGPIALPLLAAQAKQLIKAATRAPYGRGSETLVDTKVRRTWQIDGVRVTIGGKHWPKTLAGIDRKPSDAGKTREVLRSTLAGGSPRLRAELSIIVWQGSGVVAAACPAARLIACDLPVEEASNQLCRAVAGKLLARMANQVRQSASVQVKNGYNQCAFTNLSHELVLRSLSPRRPARMDTPPNTPFRRTRSAKAPSPRG